MIYKLGDTEIDTDMFREKLTKGYNLPFLKELVDMSGCTLSSARSFIDKVVEEEGIDVDPLSKEIQEYCFAELQNEE